MRPVRDPKLSATVRRRNARVAVTARGRSHQGKRARGLHRNERLPYSPPEDWYEPADEPKSDPYEFQVVAQPAGKGFRHVLTPQEIRDRLRQLPASFVAPLEVVQLSRMTRKKELFACYGMQWGSTLYLYPLESDFIEHYYAPPGPCQVQEAKMYGGRWVEVEEGHWNLIWSEQAAKDYYLNNILIHELGHLLDSRNSGYVDRERYAEWFAVQYGYKSTRRKKRVARKRIRRRHHRS